MRIIKKRYKITLLFIAIMSIAAILFFLKDSYFELSINPQKAALGYIKLNIYEIMDGIPNDTANQLIKKSGFWLAYDEQYEQANWTAYILTKEMVRTGVVSRSNKFMADTTVVTGSAELQDYYNSGFHRGHLVPAADMDWSLESMNESFLLSNISPQTPAFNQGIWKRLENKVREWAIINDSIYVITGPILIDIDQTLGRSAVGIPKYYYKIILDISYPTFKGIGFILRNEGNKNDIFDFAVSIDSIEELMNIDFFYSGNPQLMDSIEHYVNLSDWN